LGKRGDGGQPRTHRSCSPSHFCSQDRAHIRTIPRISIPSTASERLHTLLARGITRTTEAACHSLVRQVPPDQANFASASRRQKAVTRDSRGRRRHDHRKNGRARRRPVDVHRQCCPRGTKQEGNPRDRLHLAHHGGWDTSEHAGEGMQRYVIMWRCCHTLPGIGCRAHQAAKGISRIPVKNRH